MHHCRWVGAGLLLPAVALTGCSADSSGGPARSSGSHRPAPGHQASSASEPAGASPTAGGTSPGRGTSPAGRGSATTSAPAIEPSVAPRSTCTKITIRVLRGSAAPGSEFAALQFVNAGSGACVLNGYPSVQLRRNGSPVGPASEPSVPNASSRTLAPGGTAQSVLQDYSSCQAPLSDEITVIAPGSSIRETRPIELRACTLRVGPLTRPS